VEIVGVAGRDSIEPMRDFVARHDLDHVIQIADVDGSVWSRFGVGGQPTWVFVSSAGEVERVFGPISDNDLQARLARIEDDR
jgi:hypothetical protein